MSDDPQWLAWRKAGITASDVARAWTGKYEGGPVAVVAEKLDMIERTVDATDDARMQRGHDLEERVTTAAEALAGVFVVGEQMWCEHHEHGWLRATVDGLTADVPEPTMDEISGVCEIKTRDQHVDRPWDYWLAQVHVQMFVTDTRRALLAEAVVDGTGILRVHLHRIDFDDALWADLFDLACRLWSWVQAGKVPPASVAADIAAVKALTAKADETADTVDLADMASEIERRASLKEQMKATEAELDLIDARIRERIGAATKATVPGFTVSYSRPTRIVTDEAAADILAARPEFGRVVLDKDRIKAEAPDLYEAHREAIGHRTLNIRRKQ